MRHLVAEELAFGVGVLVAVADLVPELFHIQIAFGSALFDVLQQQVHCLEGGVLQRSEQRTLGELDQLFGQLSEYLGQA